MDEYGRQRIANALQARAEQAIPDNLTPPSLILERWRTVAPSMVEPKIAARPANTRSTHLQAGMAMVMVTLLALAMLSIVFVTANRPQPNSLTQTGDKAFVPEG